LIDWWIFAGLTIMWELKPCQGPIVFGARDFTLIPQYCLDQGTYLIRIQKAKKNTSTNQTAFP